MIANWVTGVQKTDGIHGSQICSKILTQNPHFIASTDDQRSHTADELTLQSTGWKNNATGDLLLQSTGETSQQLIA